MSVETTTRLDRLRGNAAPRNHDARAIAALTANPGCARRGLMDAAGVDKQSIAGQLGFPAPFGQSQFAITRGNVELTSGMGSGKTAKPGTVPEVGERVVFAAFSVGGFMGQSRFPEREETPWTHGGPSEEYVPTDEDAQEAWA